jgi:hypothetical protein
MPAAADGLVDLAQALLDLGDAAERLRKQSAALRGSC